MKKSISFYIVLILVLIATFVGKNLKKWNNNSIINHDVISYYAYLPATFIYKDLTFEFAKNLPPDFEGRIWTHPAPNGAQTLRMSCGLSLLWAPFFMLAHGFAHLSSYKPDGYSIPYSISIFIAALVYLFIGLLVLRKLLLNYFNEWITAITLIMIVAATNLLHYVSVEPGMSHVYNFTLISLFLFLSLKWIEKPSYKLTILAALVAGLITLIRPVNGIVILLPLLFLIFKKGAFKANIHLGKLKWIKMLVIAAASFLIVLLPQLIYWKLITGNWLYYSYGDEGFFFNNPHILKGLFSYRKGWLVYTPVMFFALTGFIFMKKEANLLRYSLLIFLGLFMYVVFSWWCWWYGGSYGARPMIDVYCIMAFGLAAFIREIATTPLWAKITATLAFLFLIYLNSFQMRQYRISLLHWDSMTKDAYWGIMFKETWPPGYDKMIKTPDYENALQGKKEYQ